MNPLLAQDFSRLSDLREKVMDASLNYLGSIDNRPLATDFVPNGPLDLTDGGVGAGRTLGLFAQRYGRAIPASSGPRFWGFVTGGTTPARWWAIG